MFTEHFHDYACEGDSITCEVEGFTLIARLSRDHDHGPPWKEEDGHGPVSDWRPKKDKRAGEVVLSTDRYAARFYNWAEAIKIAKRDGWDAPPYGTGTKGEQAERAVKQDFELLKRWCDDEWWYGIIDIEVSKGDVDLDDHAVSLCGIGVNAGENNHYLQEVANEMIAEALKAAKKRVQEIREALG